MEQAVIKSYACGAGYRLMVCNNPNSDIGQHYDTLAELNEDWEDCEPKEPLIKDEKIRKAVRAWAEANNIRVVRVKDDYCFIDTESAANIRFYDKIGVFLKGNYTIAELCGEEE